MRPAKALERRPPNRAIPVNHAVWRPLRSLGGYAADHTRGLRPRTPSASGSLALARPPGGYAADFSRMWTPQAEPSPMT